MQNLFPSRQPSRRRSNSTSHRSISRQYTSRYGSSGTTEDRSLFSNCVAQVQRNLKAAIGSPSLLHTLASYYTKVDPVVDGRPFCVSLSFSTFLFHLQMARISIADAEIYAQLIASVISQLQRDELATHPFMKMVLHDRVFGLPSPSCNGAAHRVVLTPPPQYRAFRAIAVQLLAMQVVPIEMVVQFHTQLENLSKANSPLVSNRSLGLLIETTQHVGLVEQANALQLVLLSKPCRMNVDFVLACYERLKRIAIDPSGGPLFVRALCIQCSEIFLRFRSPIRRDYVERFLYPSLCHSDMAEALRIPATRQHLLRELLHLCTAGVSVSNPYYLCICAILQQSFDNEVDGATETLGLIDTHMPHAAYFMATLSIDSRMSVPMFAKVILALCRGAGRAMLGSDSHDDDVASAINSSAASVYSVIYTLREVVRSCASTASRRSSDMLKALRLALPSESIEALGRLCGDAFQNETDSVLNPQLICAEIAMVLHDEHLHEAIDSSIDFFRDATRQCPSCGMQCSASLICPITQEIHVAGQLAAGRVLVTLSECANAKKLHDRLVYYLQETNYHINNAVFGLIFYIVSNSKTHRLSVFNAVEPYIRGTLLTTATTDATAYRSRVSSEQRANILMFHVKLITLLGGAVDPSYYESTLKVFSEVSLRNNHDALCMWLMANILLRQSGPNLELLPTDPLENNYCVNYPECAPSSNTCAINAQLVLRLLDKAHHFSTEMRKLVGCCVCRLIQDFNMQAPNIVGSLLSSFGVVNSSLTSLTDFALPVGASSSFWSFFLHQMKSSAPARTALMATVAKSMARRFRLNYPSKAVGLSEDASHLFPTMVYEAMKRSAPLSRVILFMLSQWMKQPESTPGKFACLFYVCTQLVYVVHTRFEDSPVEQEAETTQERLSFRDTVDKTMKQLEKALPRLHRLTSSSEGDNVAFADLLRSLNRKLLFTVARIDGHEFEDPFEGENDGTNPLANEHTYTSTSELENMEDEDYMRAMREDATASTTATPHLPYLHEDATPQTPEGRRATGIAPTEAELGEPFEGRDASESTKSLSCGVQTEFDGEGKASSSPPETTTTAPLLLEHSVGTSPIHTFSSRSTTTADTTTTGQRNSTAIPASGWYEPSMIDWGMDPSNPSPSNETNTNTKATLDNVALPGAAAAAANGTHVPSSMVLDYLRTHQTTDTLQRELTQLTDTMMQSQVVHQYVATVPVSVSNVPNNYSEPHTQNFQSSAVETFMASTLVSSTSAPPTSHAPPLINIVDGETPYASVHSDGVDPKRHRLEHNSHTVPQLSKGLDFFLQRQQQDAHRTSVLNELRSTASSRNRNGGQEQHPHEKEDSPYSSMRIPPCLVEQRNDTAMRELRQVMGNQNANTERTSLLKSRSSDNRVERSSSTAWWAEMSMAPMPTYASEPQYSMELF